MTKQQKKIIVLVAGIIAAVFVPVHIVVKIVAIVTMALSGLVAFKYQDTDVGMSVLASGGVTTAILAFIRDGLYGETFGLFTAIIVLIVGWSMFGGDWRK